MNRSTVQVRKQAWRSCVIDVNQTVVRKAWSWNPARNMWLIFQCCARFMLRGR